VNALSDLPLRISVAVADLLLALRVPLPGFTAAGAHTAFHATPARPRPVCPWSELTAAGSPA
jgi:hypothetical protein